MARRNDEAGPGEAEAKLFVTCAPETGQVHLEDILWEYVEEHGLTDSARRYFEDRYMAAPVPKAANGRRTGH